MTLWGQTKRGGINISLSQSPVVSRLLSARLSWRGWIVTEAWSKTSVPCTHQRASGDRGFKKLGECVLYVYTAHPDPLSHLQYKAKRSLCMVKLYVSSTFLNMQKWPKKKKKKKKKIMMSWLTDVCKLLSHGHLAVYWIILFFHSAHVHTCQQMQQMHNRHKAAICETTRWYTQSCRLCHSITKNRL